MAEECQLKTTKKRLWHLQSMKSMGLKGPWFVLYLLPPLHFLDFAFVWKKGNLEVWQDVDPQQAIFSNGVLWGRLSMFDDI